MSIRTIQEILRTMVKPPANVDALKQMEHESRHRFFGFFVWARLAVVPLIVSFIGWVVYSDSALWRQVLLGILMVLLTVISFWDVYFFSWKKRLGSYAIQRNAIGAGLAILVVIFSTGALESPALPIILMISLVSTLVIGPKIGRLIVVGLHLPAIWIFALVSIYGLIPDIIPDVFGGGSRAGRDDVALWTTAAIYSLALIGIISFGVRLRHAFISLLKQILDERDAALSMHADQNRALTTLSGEIAHELKNPLASVKGLAALVSRGLEEGGKPAERMSVLRREVDRMQSVLEEFLNFSRPLVPLSQEPTDLALLCDDVVELHEGVSRERGVVIEVRRHDEVVLTCDPRKIKQILINLVQNAIDASPRDGLISIEVDDDDEGARITISDEGSGLSDDVIGRVFDPGVTSKAKGSGLGLTVARTLARQHGGELTLDTGQEGGCVATITLPPSEEKQSIGGTS